MSDKDTEAAANCEVCRVKCWTSEGFFGKYSYKYLCTPTVSCLGMGANAPMWLGKDEKLPLLLSVVLGLQHCLAMLAGIATSGGLLIAGDTCMAFQCALQPFMVSTSWLASGILTLIQVFRCKIRGTPFYLGTGLISVMGTSFTFLPIAREMTTAYIQDAKNTGDPRCVTLDSGVIDCPRVGIEGYGAFLGTCMVACFLEIAISFIPSRIRAKMFPPVVLGVAVMMIGAGLVSSGIKYVGGGVFCGENMATRAAAFGSGPQICNENGDVTLAFGAPQHIGLAASVILFGVVLNVAGSPFLKSTFLFWGLVFGTIVAAISSYTDDEGIQYDYFGDSAKEKVDAAPAFVFFWSEDQFPISFDIVYLLPILLATYITTAETVGDVTMTALYSGITDPEDVNERIQGGLLADGVNSFLACCFGTAPNTTFSQNNGIIKLSQCASRSAGFACAIWLILLGIFGKIGAAFTTIPIAVVGGVVLQCFTMVFVAGMSIVAPTLNRRNSYIVMLSIAFGLGVAMEPQLFEASGAFYAKNLRHNFGLWPEADVCARFPTVTTVLVPATCGFAGGAVELSEADCLVAGGNYSAPVLGEPVEVTTCINNNGNCCAEYKAGRKGLRTAVMMLLKTPYGIGVIIAVILNAILPHEKEDVSDDDIFGKKTRTASSEPATEAI